MTSKEKKIYFASDFHLGVPTYERSLEREKLIVRWLDEVSKDASAIYLVGDIFDFWFEYKHAIPKGFVRLQGKIAELTDKGVSIHFFTGNHDMWMFDYHEKELGITMHRAPILLNVQGKKILLGHGDGLGPGDKGYKFIKKVFANRFFQWCFARFHPNFGIGIANYFSKSSRAATGEDDRKYLGAEGEWLAIYAREKLKEEHIDYFIFGHRHLPIVLPLQENSTYINLGEWMHYSTFAELTDGKLTLKEFPSMEIYQFKA